MLTCGPVPPNPSELLISDQARAIIRQIAEKVDYTIIDTAPLLPVADGAEVAAIADATLVVHHAGKSTREQAARSVEALAKVGQKPVGVVLNMITRGRGRFDEAYGYYYEYRPNRPGRGRHLGALRAAPTGGPDADVNPQDLSRSPGDPGAEPMHPPRSERHGEPIPTGERPS